MFKGWVISGILAILWAALQIVVFQIWNPARKFRSLTLLFVPTVPLFLIAYVAMPDDLWCLPSRVSSTPFGVGLLNGILVHFLIYCGYVVFFFTFSRSINLRILSEFRQAKDHLLTLRQLQDLYPIEPMLKERLKAMVANDYVWIRDGRYRLSSSGRLLAGFISSVRRFFPIKPL